MASDYDRIAAAIRYLMEHSHEQPSLARIAEHVGVSPSHLQRSFKRWAGVSPKRFLQFLTASEAKRLLRESASVLDTSFAVGLSGPGRLHDLMLNAEAVTPGQYKSAGEGLEIRYGFYESPFGTCLIAATDRGVCALHFTDSRTAALDSLESEWPRAEIVRDDEAARPIARAIFEGAGSDPLTLHVRGTNFQLKVWEALLRVPEGCLISYGDLAARIGRPTATRAVANAVGANPIAYLIPCHRVIRESGALGGYAGGLERKVAILARESSITASDSPRRT